MKIAPREIGTVEVPLKAGECEVGRITLRVFTTATSRDELANLRAEAQGLMEAHRELADEHDQDALDYAASGDSSQAEGSFELAREHVEISQLIERLLAELPS